MAEALWAGSLGGAVSDWAVARLRAAGIEVRLGTAAGAVLPDGVRAGEELIPSVLTLAGVGVRPRTALAEAAGLRVADGIVVDQARSAARGVFAAGDVARFPHPLADGGRIRVEHWHAAREGGERAALGMLGRRGAAAAGALGLQRVRGGVGRGRRLGPRPRRGAGPG